MEQLTTIDLAGIDPSLLADLDGNTEGCRLYEIPYEGATVSNQRYQMVWRPDAQRAGIVFVGSGSSGLTEWLDAKCPEDALQRARSLTGNRLAALADEILNADNLGALKDGLDAFEAECCAADDSTGWLPVQDELRRRGVDMTALPTFGGETPENTASVWSWDATHLLVGEGELDIVTREEWADAVARYERHGMEG